MLAASRSKLVRLAPEEARVAMDEGAYLVDIRPLEQRKREGDVPGAIIVGRTVLEWRLCPSSPDRIHDGPGYDDAVIVMCSHGYSSSLAAATLQELGFHRATDLEGGIHAWADVGLPVEPSRGATDEEAHGHTELS